MFHTIEIDRDYVDTSTDFKLGFGLYKCELTDKTELWYVDSSSSLFWTLETNFYTLPEEFQKLWEEPEIDKYKPEVKEQTVDPGFVLKLVALTRGLVKDVDITSL